MSCLAHAVNFEESDVHALEPLISREEIREKVRRALCLHVGRGRRFSVDDLSLGAGVPRRCIQAAMAPINDENYRPLTLENLASISKFLKAPFASTILEVCGLGAFELMDGQQPPLPKILTAESAPVPRETPREKVERLQRELLDAIEELKA